MRVRSIKMNSSSSDTSAGKASESVTSHLLVMTFHLLCHQRLVLLASLTDGLALQFGCTDQRRLLGWTRCGGRGEGGPLEELEVRLKCIQKLLHCRGLVLCDMMAWYNIRNGDSWRVTCQGLCGRAGCRIIGTTGLREAG